MQNFWDYEVWCWIILFAVLLGSLLVGNIIKKSIGILRNSLIPTSVIGGLLLLATAFIYEMITGEIMFDADIFNGKGTANLESITYHTLALGFIASAFKTTNKKLTKDRVSEIFNTGVTTVSTYLLQAVVGIVVTLIAALVISDFFSVSGILLPFGFGQGTGQALNYGTIYETEFGFDGGKSFGLTIAAFGFIAAAVGGVFHLNIKKKKGTLVLSTRDDGSLHSEPPEPEREIPMQESIDKMTIQIALIFTAYICAYILMFLLGKLFPGMKAVIYGFNFLLGVLTATLIKLFINFLRKKRLIRKKYTNNFLMTRACNFLFDIMVVAGIAAIRIDTLEKYMDILLILCIIGTIVTYIYNRLVAKILFKDYTEEQFLVMYGMLTGTASTGIILLREIDREFKTPASDNIVYQNFPAIILGFPIMLLATLAPKKPILCLLIFTGMFLIFNILLFRSKIFKRKNKS